MPRIERFYPREDDPVVNTHAFDGHTVEIRCASNGTFYVEFEHPTTTIKDRSLSKLRTLLDAEMEHRKGKISIPFLRVDPDDTMFSPDKLIIHRVVNGVGLFRRRTGIDVHDSKTTTWYGGERFLRVLSPDEWQTLADAISTRTEAERRVGELIDQFELNLDEVLKAQQDGTYPTSHTAAEAEEEA